MIAPQLSDSPMRAAPLWLPLLVAAWLGAALFFAVVVARAAFAVLPTRALAGALVGRTLPVLFFAGIVVALLAVVVAWDSGTPARRHLAAAGGVMAVACVVAQLGVARRIEAVRAAIGPSLDALDPADPRRVAFGRLHGISVMLLGVAMLAAAWLVVAAARVPGGRR